MPPRTRTIRFQSPFSSATVLRRIPGRNSLPSPFSARAVRGFGLRAYAAEATEDIAGEDDDVPITNTHTDEKPKRQRKRDSLLLEIAKEGTSPKLRQELQEQKTGESKEKHHIDFDAIKKAEAAASKEVIWLTDRATLAERVDKVLQKRDPLFAATLVRKSQTLGLGSTAAWNHLMEYCMRENEPQAAWRFYNEVGCSSFWGRGMVWIAN